MGFAIIWILLFHIQLFGQIAIFSNIIAYKIINYGFMGVDIFIILSGFGLYFSFQQTRLLKNFYLKRILRIYPSYIIALLFFTLLTFLLKGTVDTSFTEFLYQILTLDYWLDGSLNFWYVPLILLIYLLSPLFFNLFNKNPLYVTIIVVVLGLLLTVFLRLINADIHLYYAIPRISIFPIGAYMAYILDKKKYNDKNKKNLLYVGLFISMLIGVAYLVYSDGKTSPEINRVLKIIFLNPNIYIVPGFVYTLAYFFHLLSKLRFINLIFILTGTISFELYVMHMPFFLYFQDIKKQLNCNSELLSVILLMLSLLLAYIVYGFVTRLNSKILQIDQTKAFSK